MASRAFQRNYLQSWLLQLLIVCGIGALSALPEIAHAIDYVPTTALPKVNFNDPSGLVNGFVRLLVVAAAFLAIGQIMRGGFMYMTTEAVTGKGTARGIIQDAVLGLLLILGSVLVLQIINPNILNINLLNQPLPASTTNTQPSNLPPPKPGTSTSLPQTTETPSDASRQGIIRRAYAYPKSCPPFITEDKITYTYHKTEANQNKVMTCSYLQAN